MNCEKGCSRNRVLEGGGSTVYSLAGALLPGIPLNNAYPVVNDVGCGAAARPMVNPGQPGLPGMSGGSRRGMRRGRKTTRRGRGRKQRGGRYTFDLSPQMVGQAYNPNQFATVVGMRGETCTAFNRNQTGGAALSPAPINYPPTITATPASYQAGYEVPKTVYTNVPELVPQQAGSNIVPILRQDQLGAAEISGACKQTGGLRRSRRSRKGRKSSKKTRRSKRHSRKH
jgi:hypothetical protein